VRAAIERIDLDLEHLPVMSSQCHLHRIDHPAWREEPDYNPDVTPRLAAAYATIQQVPDRIASFRDAGYQIIALGDLPMCRQQRMNVCYLLGMAHAADEEYSHAWRWLDQAVTLARALDDRLAQIDLLFLRGPVAQRMDLYHVALDDYRAALDLHTTLRREHLAVDRTQELHLLVVAAGYALSQEEYALTRRLLSTARRVARRVAVAAAPGTIAHHAWVRAAYLDACGDTERALQPALRATTTAAQDGVDAYVVVRIHAFAARLATDLAVTHAEHSVARSTQLGMAAHCLRAARRALAPNDRAGKGYIEMRQARLDALHGRAAHALERIDGVEQRARALDDGPLLIYALTVHGQILEERPDDWEAALLQYREALALSSARGLPFAGLLARRALRRLEERLPHEEHC
jgi:tetratricopeptide (TPR) repeat protein